MKDFGGVLEELREVWPQLTEAEQAHNAEMIAGQEAMSGFLAMMNTSDPDFDKLQGNIENSTGKAQEMADVMQDNLAGQITELKSQLEGLAIDFGELVVPAIGDLVEKLSEGVTWFSELDDKTKENIITAGKFAAALGPALFITGKVAGSIGSVVTLMGKLSGGAGLASTAIGTGGAGLGGAMAGTLGAILPWGIAIAGAGAAAYGLYKYLNEDAIPEIDIFGDSVSENTKEAVGGFLELEEEGTKALNQLTWSGAVVTEEMKDTIVANTEEMKNQVVAKLQEEKELVQTELYEMFENSTTMSQEEKDEMVRIATEKYDGMIEETEKGQAEIDKIMQKAVDEGRVLRTTERREIEEIRAGMKEDGIRLLSETEIESLAILERLKAQSGEITAEMAAEVVKNSLEQKDQAITNAEDEYNERLKFAATLRSEGTEEAEKMADKIVEEATRQKDEAIKKAEEMHDGVVSEAKKQAAEHVEQIDWETGEIMSKWEIMDKWFQENPIVRWIKTKTEEYGGSTGNYGGITSTFDVPTRDPVIKPLRNAMGTDFFEGGRTWVGEHGPEIIELPTGSKVYNNQESLAMAGAGGDIKNYFNISKMEIREEADIKKVANELFSLQQSKNRGRGIK